MNNVSIERLLRALHDSWSAETAFSDVLLSADNPARGQCVASCLVLQNYLGGDLIRYKVSGLNLDEMHYVNLLEDGTILDSTGSQYTEPVTLTKLAVDLKGFSSIREKRLADAETKQRYELLSLNVAKHLAESAS